MDDSTIEKLRNRQVKNFLTVTLLSLSMPMIFMGDEVWRTQRSSNNVCCQDAAISLFDWSLAEKHADVLRYVTHLIARRKLRVAEHERQRETLNHMLRRAKYSWHGVKPGQPDWSAHSHSVAFTAELQVEKLFLHMILNYYWEPLNCELPLLERSDKWRGWIGTALESPQDSVPWQTSPPISTRTYHADARSVMVLVTGGE